MTLILRGLMYFLDILSWIIIINALLSWFMRPDHPVKAFLDRLLYPIMRPFRALFWKFTGNSPVDFSPMLAILAIYILRMLIQAIYFRI